MLEFHQNPEVVTYIWLGELGKSNYHKHLNSISVITIITFHRPKRNVLSKVGQVLHKQTENSACSNNHFNSLKASLST